MTIAPGSRLGVYEIVGLIGAGGMGEVYRARDTRLSRDVAIKVLPAGVIDDADRRARFEREAQVLASLNHAGIATIHGVEESGASVALVMELVEGPTLAERIASGPLPAEDAIAIARQICDALEYAHERGVIHRDLKPANIKVRPDGAVKLLDFGLAKALEPDAVPGAAASATHSPTLSLAGTRAGVILGTAGYMAPEQARGGAADRRSDIWAFGCVLFEMLAGKQSFGGATVSDALAAVLRADPDWGLIPGDTPAHIRRLLKRCLEKDPRRRLQHIGDARLELEDAGEPVQTLRPVPRRTRTVWAIAGGTVIGAAIVGSLWAVLPERTTSPRLVRFRTPLPVRTTTGGQSILISPDGRTIVTSFGASAGPSAMLFKRRLDGLTFEPVRGTEGGLGPFLSPDSAWIAFFSEGKLKKVSIDGGLAVTICDAQRSQGAWGDDGSIVLARDDKLYKVPSTGGVPEAIADMPSTEGVFLQPQFLPGSRAVLMRAGFPGRTGGRIVAVDLRTRARQALVDGNTPRLDASGNLLFEREGGIWAVGFDAEKLTTVGTPVRVVDAVRVLGATALFSVSRDGSLVYVAGEVDTDATMVWIDRTGKPTPAIGTRADYQSPRLSPDGRRVVVSIPSASGIDLWVYEFERGTRLRLTTSGINRRGVFTPDGARFAFYSAGAADQNLFVMPSSGGQAKTLLVRPAAQFPDMWSPDGRFLVFDEGGATRDLWLLPAGEEPRPLLVTRFNERGAIISPDGRWLAFVTDESGRDEVYVQPFPGPGAKVAVSTGGGIQPMWSRDGRELFYREGDWMMTAGFNGQPFRVTAAKKLFEFSALAYSADGNFADYDVAPDGRFVAIRHDRTGTDDVHVVLNWSEEVRRALKR